MILKRTSKLKILKSKKIIFFTEFAKQCHYFILFFLEIQRSIIIKFNHAVPVSVLIHFLKVSMGYL